LDDGDDEEYGKVDEKVLFVISWLEDELDVADKLLTLADGLLSLWLSSSCISRFQSSSRSFSFIFSFCLSSLYEAVSSSNSLELTSMKVFNTLYTRATIVWFQCSFEMRYNAGNMIGIITELFSSIKVNIYSLFQKKSARSAT